MLEEVVVKNPTGMLKTTTTWLKEAPVLPSLALLGDALSKQRLILLGNIRIVLVPIHEI